MRTAFVPSPGEFLDRAGTLLEADEARHNLILSLAHVLRDHPDVYPEFGLWVVEEDGRPVGAALITPRNKLVLADAADRRALEALAPSVRESALPVPGVVANRPTVDHFVTIWEGLTGAAPRLHMAQGLFALERVLDVDPAPGRPRPATPADRSIVVDWVTEFTAEALPEEQEDRERTEQRVDRLLDPAIAYSGVWLWEDGARPVSLVAFGSPSPGGARLGPVYTPPSFRRRGYGTALVAAVSTWLLEHGRRRCFLYTDLSNPTSNAIYRAIGYQQVAESAAYGFDAPG